LSSYLALSGIWFVLASVYIALALKEPGQGMAIGGIVALSVGVLCVFWLRGFRLRMTDDHLEYRDGLYRSISIPLREVTKAKQTWVGWTVLGRSLRIPRFVVVYGTQNDRVTINTKPFSRDDLQRLLGPLRTT